MARVLRYSDVQHILTWVTWQELLVLHRCLGSPSVFCAIRVVHLFSFLVLCFLFCLSSSGVLYPMLPVSLYCPFLIVPSVFSNVYLHITSLCSCISSQFLCQNKLFTSKQARNSVIASHDNVYLYIFHNILSELRAQCNLLVSCKL